MKQTNPANHLISLQQAKAFINQYQEKRTSLLAGLFAGKEALPLSETFDRAAFDALLQQPGCTGVRIYYGMNEQEAVNLVVVGVDEQGKDLVTAESDTNIILEYGKRCPPDCGEESALTS